MTADEAKRLLAQHGSQRKAAKAAGVARSTFQGFLDGSQERAAAKSGAHIAPVRAIGRSLTEFRQAYDKDTIIPSRVDATLKALGNGWLYEVEFAKQAGLKLTDLSLYRDKYALHIVQVKEGRRVWFGRTAQADQARRML